MPELPLPLQVLPGIPNPGRTYFPGTPGSGTAPPWLGLWEQRPRLFPAQAPKRGEGGWQGRMAPFVALPARKSCCFFLGSNRLRGDAQRSSLWPDSHRTPWAAWSCPTGARQPLGLPSQLWGTGPVPLPCPAAAHPPLCASPGRGSRLKEPRLEASLCSRSPLISSVWDRSACAKVTGAPPARERGGGGRLGWGQFPGQAPAKAGCPAKRVPRLPCSLPVVACSTGLATSPVERKAEESKDAWEKDERKLGGGCRFTPAPQIQHLIEKGR